MPRKSDRNLDETELAAEASPVLIEHLVIINGHDVKILAADAEDLAQKVAAIRATL